MNQSPDPEPPIEGENAERVTSGDDANPPTSEHGPATPSAAPVGEAGAKKMPTPSFLFLGILSIVSLALDLGTKWWALGTLEKPLPNGGATPVPIELTSWLTLILARNRGGAWGLLQTANEEIRKPFFLIISVLAIGFIVYLYRKVHPKQHALKWGLPLVLGGAIGNLVDRVRYGWVIDFIDYQSEWVRWLNTLIARVWSAHAVTDHWPTFNIADVAICIGVGLMAVDMFSSRGAMKEVEASKVEVEEPASDANAELQDSPDAKSASESSITAGSREPEPPAEQSKF